MPQKQQPTTRHSHHTFRCKLKPELTLALVDLSISEARSPKAQGRLVPFKFARNELGHRLSRVPGAFCGAVIAGKAVMLRTDHAGDFNVSDLARLYGGGGHATAAAFQIDDTSSPFLPAEDDAPPPS